MNTCTSRNSFILPAAEVEESSVENKIKLRKLKMQRKQLPRPLSEKDD